MDTRHRSFTVALFAIFLGAACFVFPFSYFRLNVSVTCDKQVYQRTETVHISALVKDRITGANVREGAVSASIICLSSDASKGTVEIRLPMSFSVEDGLWKADYKIPKNLTAGQYAVTVTAKDGLFGLLNGSGSMSIEVTPAKLNVSVILSKGSIIARTYITYPDGSNATPTDIGDSIIGNVMCELLNGSVRQISNITLAYDSVQGCWYGVYHFKSGDPEGKYTVVVNIRDASGNVGSTAPITDLLSGLGVYTYILVLPEYEFGSVTGLSLCIAGYVLWHRKSSKASMKS